ncbi:MAG TPA: peptidyl-prolyl cis-trans isomerase [bacterium]|nr:peptidyl-prolyl cis-trans isomerase [bacterium]
MMSILHEMHICRIGCLCFIPLAMLMAGNCGGGKSSVFDDDLVLARYGNEAITAGDLLAILVERNQFDYLLLQKVQDVIGKEIRATLPEMAYRRVVSEMARSENLQEAEDYRKWREDLVSRKLGQLVLDIDTKLKISVTDEDVERYYRENPSEFTKKETYTFRGIVAFDENNGGREKAMERLKEARKKLDAGEDFEAVAQQYSDSPLLLRGKAQGPRPRGDPEMPPELEAAILSCATGEYTDILERSKSAVFFQLMDRTPEVKEEFTPITQAKIRGKMFAERQHREEQILVEQLVTKDRLVYEPDLLAGPDVKDASVVLEVRGFPPVTYAEFRDTVRDLAGMTTQERRDKFDRVAASLFLRAEARRRGYTEEDVAPRVRYWDEIELEDRYVRSLIDREQLTGEEMQAYYESHTDEFVTEPKYDLYRIFFEAKITKEMTRFQQTLAFEQAHMMAEEAYQQIAFDGLPFQDAARQYSSDMVTASQGGYVGKVTMGQLGPDYASLFRLTDQLEPGLVLPPELSKDYSEHLGYDLYYCADIEPSRALSFEEALPLVGQKMAESRQSEIRAKLHQGVAEKYPLKIDEKAVEELARKLGEFRESASSDAEWIRVLLPKSRRREPGK